MESALGAGFEGPITRGVKMEEGSGNPINQNGYLYPTFERAHRFHPKEGIGGWGLGVRVFVAHP